MRNTVFAFIQKPKKKQSNDERQSKRQKQRQNQRSRLNSVSYLLVNGMFSGITAMTFFLICIGGEKPLLGSSQFECI